eukprot:Hpha_TRINITY_DN16271_c3_g5::TRINITY_DN16271_c3_g5_i2::g.13583::m.13583
MEMTGAIMAEEKVGYGSCYAVTGDSEAPATSEECGGLSDSQSAPMLQEEYEEFFMPPSAPQPQVETPWFMRLGDWDDGCRVAMAMGLCIAAAMGCFLVLILLVTGIPEPGWMEVLTATLFAVSAAWLYTLVNQAAALREFKEQNKQLRQQVDQLEDVQHKLNSLAGRFEGDVGNATQFLNDLGGTMNTKVALSIFDNFIDQYQRRPGYINADEAEEFLDSCLALLWHENQHFHEKGTREALLDWLRDDMQGRSVAEIVDLAQRVVYDEKQLQWPDRTTIPPEHAAALPPASPRPRSYSREHSHSECNDTQGHDFSALR